MSSSQLVKAFYGNKYRPVNLRQITLPVAVSPTLTADAAGSTYGIWADIALLATINTDTLVVGIVASVPSALDEYTIDIGSTLVNGVAYANAAAVTAVGAVAIAAAHRAETRVYGGVYTFAGVAAGDMAVTIVQGFVPLVTPVFIPNGTGIIGRTYGITAVAVTINVSVVCLQNFE